MLDAGKYVTVFTDASFCHEYNCYGYAGWIKYGNPAKSETIRGGGDFIKNSTSAEYVAMSKTVNRCIELGIVKDKIIVLQTDCDHVIRNGKVLVESLKVSGAFNAYFKHVKGHRGYSDSRSSVNTICDRIAGEQMRMRRDAISKTRVKRK